jgi:hypothetical protein
MEFVTAMYSYTAQVHIGTGSFNQNLSIQFPAILAVAVLSSLWDQLPILGFSALLIALIMQVELANSSLLKASRLG